MQTLQPLSSDRGSYAVILSRPGDVYVGGQRVGGDQRPPTADVSVTGPQPLRLLASSKGAYPQVGPAGQLQLYWLSATSPLWQKAFDN